MATDLNSLRRAGTSRPMRAVIYSPQGVGKTNLASMAPDPVFIQTEDGFAEENEIPSFGILTSYEQVLDALCSLINDEHEFKTVVLDTIDHLEPMVWEETCNRNGWSNIEGKGKGEEPNYGKGYDAALDIWRELFACFDQLRNGKKNMTVLYLAHAMIKRFEGPETEPYDRYEIKLHESKAGRGARALIQEHVDAVFFMNYRVSILKDGKAPTGNKGDDRHARGTGGGQRVVYTSERPAYKAKNRYSMPESISLPNDPALAWSTVAQHISYYNQPAADAA